MCLELIDFFTDCMDTGDFRPSILPSSRPFKKKIDATPFKVHVEEVNISPHSTEYNHQLKVCILYFICREKILKAVCYVVENESMEKLAS